LTFKSISPTSKNTFGAQYATETTPSHSLPCIDIQTVFSPPQKILLGLNAPQKQRLAIVCHVSTFKSIFPTSKNTFGAQYATETMPSHSLPCIDIQKYFLHLKKYFWGSMRHRNNA
jgi:hypothetical protein